ncbi:toll-like receptor 4 [Diadema antillarum]|uniref:toll-like receptor 4 n=1 Tax=Diadema antillarum TaxID=105358 RepID=UPI003A86AFC0
MTADCRFLGLTKIPKDLPVDVTELDVGYNDITALYNDSFSGFPALTTLRASFNDMVHIEKRLSYVYIANNVLSVVAEGTALPKYFLDISGNPLSCVCQLQWFRRWIDKSNVTLMRPNQTVCSKTSLDGLQGKLLLSFDPKYKCGPDVILYISIVFIILGLLLGVIMSYNKRWWLQYKLFHLKLLLIGYEEVEDARKHTDYRYDINIIFYDDDLEWVEQVLMPGIEEKLPDLNRFVCGDDDLPLGMYYMDAVIYVIENSYKTIVVVSEAAVTNHNFITKLRHVVDNMNEEEVEKAILVFVRDLPADNLPYLVRLFLSENKPYILWNEDMYGQLLFWDKLVKNISINRRMNDLMPI